MFERMNQNPKWKEVCQWVAAIIVILVFVAFVRAYIVRTVRVKGNSMEPNFSHNDFLIINEIGYHFSKPKRNDIVICYYEKGVKENYIIKRVIAVEGDKIDILTTYPEGELQYVVSVNGEELNEKYLKETMQQKGDLEYPYIVPEGSYFVMGDNRNASSDSRTKEIGAIPKENILGKVFFRVLPLEKMGVIK